ncbi:hypothetical protein CsatB_027692 [Cannabis sativa]
MTIINEPTQPKRQQKRQNDNPNTSSSSFFQCAELLLPWLTPTELANVSLTSKTLNRIAKSITLRRISDVSRNHENLPIPCSNSADEELYPYFFYTSSQIPSSRFPNRQSWGSASAVKPDPNVRVVEEWVGLGDGCECERCEDGEYCPCLRFDGLEGLVSECGPSCGCDLECGNRLSQRGVSVMLKIVKDERKGWCVCSAQFISKGQFICEYAGELLTTKEARKRHQDYDRLASSDGFSSALLVVREHLPSGKACLRLNIDATRVGNVARFINHSCDGGNLSTSLVRSSGSLLPRLAFFASKNIKEDEELTFSYGGVRLSSNGSPCFCGSSSCFGWLPSEET